MPLRINSQPPQKFSHIPTNLVMGFLGAGKTTAILHLLEQKPAGEKWAVLVNEFGQIGIDGAIFAAKNAIVREVPGGCLCCAAGPAFQVALNRLIEPTGLGHPKWVLERLTGGYFRTVLDVRAGICLVDPRKFGDIRYTANENFVDQIALSDVLVANKTDLADKTSIRLFERWADSSRPPKSIVAHTVQGQLDAAWLDLPRNPERQAAFPKAHQAGFLQTNKDQGRLKAANDYRSFGHVFPEQSRFDYARTTQLLNRLEAARIKAVLATDKGWFIFNAVDGEMTLTECQPSANSRIEIITSQTGRQDILSALNQCIISDIPSNGLPEM
ncbi:MAG: CobW family GTP-binding protein [Gammaproteobacteria bacterium]